MMGQRFILEAETYKLSHCSMISKAGNKPEIKTSYRSGCCSLDFGLGSLYQQALTLGRKIKQVLAGFSKDRFGVSLRLMSKCKKDPDFFLFGFDSLVSKKAANGVPSESSQHIWGS